MPSKCSYRLSYHGWAHLPKCVNALIFGLMSADVRKELERIWTHNPLHTWQAFLTSEILGLLGPYCVCQGFDLLLMSADTLKESQRVWSQTFSNPVPSELSGMLRLTLVCQCFDPSESNQVISKRALKGFELTMLSTHGKSSHPLSYREYKDLPTFLKALTVRSNPSDWKRSNSPLAALVAILLTL